jgi:hypothetical protein
LLATCAFAQQPLDSHDFVNKFAGEMVLNSGCATFTSAEGGFSAVHDFGMAVERMVDIDVQAQKFSELVE